MLSEAQRLIVEAASHCERRGTVFNFRRSALSAQAIEELEKAAEHCERVQCPPIVDLWGETNCGAFWRVWLWEINGEEQC